MINILIIFYIICQLFEAICFAYFYFKDELEFTKDNVTVMSLLLAFGPLGVIAFFVALIHEKIQTKKRFAASRIMTRWENAARNSCDHDNHWDWINNGKNSESRYNHLRDTIGMLTDWELQLLITIAKSTYEIEKPLRDAIMDEIIHREIMKA